MNSIRAKIKPLFENSRSLCFVVNTCNLNVIRSFAIYSRMKRSTVIFIYNLNQWRIQDFSYEGMQYCFTSTNTNNPPPHPHFLFRRQNTY